jgi:hypothetical protein
MEFHKKFGRGGVGPNPCPPPPKIPQPPKWSLSASLPRSPNLLNDSLAPHLQLVGQVSQVGPGGGDPPCGPPLRGR